MWAINVVPVGENHEGFRDSEPTSQILHFFNLFNT